MPAPFLTDAQVLGALAEALQKDDPDALAVAPGVIADANLFAGQAIVGALLARGFAPAQIDAWDQVGTFARHLALFWCFAYGGVPYPGESSRIKAFDRRNELVTTALFVGGAMQFPGAAAESDPGGSVSHGTVGGGFTPLSW